MPTSPAPDRAPLTPRDRALGAALIIGALLLSGISVAAARGWPRGPERAASGGPILVAADSATKEAICRWRMRSHWPAGA
ncbi:MAG: hypothetical protein ABJD07_06850 [Gemmatimonadaceae bacterium]